MRPIFRNWNTIERHLKERPVALYLDFDGTLSPIVPKVDDASLPKENKAVLKRLCKKFNGRVAIVSGRALKDLKKKVGLKELIYVGNHGLQIEGPRIRFKQADGASARAIMKRLKKELAQEMKSIRGTFLEDKDLTMSLHYRMVKKDQIPLVVRTFKRVARPFISGTRIKVNVGKMVFEIKPPGNWHKGAAVRWLLERFERRSGGPCFPVYIGDDVTDEDAFRAIRKNGLGVGVGKARSSQAKFFVKDQRQVTRFLERLAVLS